MQILLSCGDDYCPCCLVRFISCIRVAAHAGMDANIVITHLGFVKSATMQKRILDELKHGRNMHVVRGEIIDGIRKISTIYKTKNSKFCVPIDFIVDYLQLQMNPHPQDVGCAKEA